jgi:Holliday junction resolvasome RuvABC endonuclease subunit
MGIDPSLRGCAVALSLPDRPCLLERWSSKPNGPGVFARAHRYRELVAPVVELARQWMPDLIVIEGYAFAMHGSRGHDIIEFGGVLREHLTRYCARFLEVAPSQLKLFGAGNGRADKKEIAAAVHERYGRVFESHDEADAWVCMQIGRCLLGEAEPTSAFEHEVICKLTGRPVPKRPKAVTRKQKELFR